jgi:hypothetical protein
MNGSGCIVAGEPALNEVGSPTEARVRRIVKKIAGGFLAIGAVWLAIVAYSFSTREFVTATVEGIIPQSGECRRPSGRYQDCVQSRAVVNFSIAAPTAGSNRGASAGPNTVKAEIFIPARGVTLKAGDSVNVGYDPANPQDVILPNLRSVATAPLGLFLTALLVLGMERLTRR